MRSIHQGKLVLEGLVSCLEAEVSSTTTSVVGGFQFLVGDFTFDGSLIVTCLELLAFINDVAVDNTFNVEHPDANTTNKSISDFFCD